MKYAHIINAFQNTPWAITPSKLAEIAGFLEMAASGVVLDKDTVRAQFGAIGGRSTSVARAGSVAIIPMFGVISQRTSMMQDYSGGVSVAQLTQNFREAMNDESINTVLFHGDTPGGGVPGVPELAEEIFEARGQGKRLIAFTDHQLCSAGLWIGAACDEIVVSPSGETGCRGVLAAHIDVSKADEMDGVKRTLISYDKTPLKTAGHPYAPLSDEDKAAIQADVNHYGEMFDNAYAKYKGLAVSVVQAGHGLGATLPSAQAVQAGIADRILTMDQLMAELLAPESRGRSRRRAMAQLAIKSS